MGDGNITHENAGQETETDGIPNPQEICGYGYRQQEALQSASSDSATRRQETTGSNVGRNTTPKETPCYPHRRATDLLGWSIRTGKTAPRRHLRAMRLTGKDRGASYPGIERPEPKRKARKTPLDDHHGISQEKNIGGLPILPQRYPRGTPRKKRREPEQHIIGEPRAVKAARVVRRGTDGTGPAMAPRQPSTLLRECVRKHGRLPQSIITDGGKEFNSIYFESFLALKGCSLYKRPWSDWN
jgi:hypothetical protein